MKVVIVDDEPTILLSTGLLVDDLGHSVVRVGRAGEILERLLRERPDVLLQDARMPGLDLPTLIRAEATLAQMRIVIFSASLEVRELAETLGVGEYLETPFKPEQLAAAIARPPMGPPA